LLQAVVVVQVLLEAMVFQQIDLVLADQELHQALQVLL
jgi:hypothetical protein